MWTRKDAAEILAAAVFFLTVGLLLFPPAGSPATRPDPAAAKIAHAFLKVELAAEHQQKLAGPHTISVVCRHAAAATFRCHDVGVNQAGVHTCVSFLARWNPTVPDIVQISPASLAYCSTTGGPPA